MAPFSLSPEPSQKLRQAYFDSMEEPQEFFLEELANAGQFWTHDDGAYAITHGKTLVEFFSRNSENSTPLLGAFHDQQGFSTALVKSYDHSLVRSLEQLGWQASVKGFLFRKREARDQTTFPNAVLKAGASTDVDPLWDINDDFFESQSEIVDLARAGKLWAVSVNGEIAGCGVSNQFMDDSDAVDIGMMVAAGFRRQGLGTHIVSEIAKRIESAGLRPICGCGASNIASKATLEKAGFVSEHQLLSFTL